MKILIAVEEKVSRLAIQRILENNGFDAEMCDDGEKALELVKKNRDFRIVVSDRSLPGIDGFNLCSDIRKLNLPRHVYFIIIVSDIKKDITEAINAGIDDYINHPFDNEVFTFKIKSGIRMLEIEDKLFKSQKELIKLVREDPLTTLLNRRSFIDESVRQRERASRENQEASLILVDIDDFTEINDMFGNQYGDSILVELGERLRYACRPYDTIGRYGGEEFIVFLANCKASNAAKISKRLKNAVSKKIYEIKNEKITLTASLGVCSVSPDVGSKSEQVDDMIKRAELALNKAKEQGKNKIVISN